MTTQNEQENQALLEQLKALSSGLYFLSESEFPFEVVHSKAPLNGLELPSLLLQQFGEPADSNVEVEELSYFFRNHTDLSIVDQETVARFQELKEFLIQNLKNIGVYRVGERRITAYILGKTARGGYVGLKTVLIET